MQQSYNQQLVTVSLNKTERQVKTARKETMPKFFSNLLRNKTSSRRKHDRASKTDDVDAKLLLTSQSIHGAEGNCYSPPPSLPVEHFSSKDTLGKSSPAPVSSNPRGELYSYSSEIFGGKLNETLGRSKLRQQKRQEKQEPSLPCIFSDVEFNEIGEGNVNKEIENSLDFETSDFESTFDTKPWPTSLDFGITNVSKSRLVKPQSTKQRQNSSASTKCSTTTDGSCSQSNFSSSVSNFSSGQSHLSSTRSNISRGTLKSFRSSKSRRSRSLSRGESIRRSVSKTVFLAEVDSSQDSHFHPTGNAQISRSTGDILGELSAEKAFVASFPDEEQSTLLQNNKDNRKSSEGTGIRLGCFLQKNTSMSPTRGANKSIAAESAESSIFEGLESIPDEIVSADNNMMAPISEGKEESVPSQAYSPDIVNKSYSSSVLDASSSSSSDDESLSSENHNQSDDYEMKYRDSMKEEEEEEEEELIFNNTTASSSEVFMALSTGTPGDEHSHQHVVSFVNSPPESPSCENSKISQGSPNCVSDVDVKGVDSFPVNHRQSEDELTRELAWVQLSSRN